MEIIQEIKRNHKNIITFHNSLIKIKVIIDDNETAHGIVIAHQNNIFFNVSQFSLSEIYYYSRSS